MRGASNAGKLKQRTMGWVNKAAEKEPKWDNANTHIPKAGREKTTGKKQETEKTHIHPALCILLSQVRGTLFWTCPSSLHPLPPYSLGALLPPDAFFPPPPKVKAPPSPAAGLVSRVPNWASSWAKAFSWAKTFDPCEQEHQTTAHAAKLPMIRVMGPDGQVCHVFRTWINAGRQHGLLPTNRGQHSHG